ncbi:hypothetical protein OIDMADRAFT_32631 [Oidiodendron maius Zn]|uniref:Uncharacterized protein n=1 Tax=Oidiodendron maius (strain Zn) TaxID=913774 RepID=A0A0C3H2H2_OIDMZ|nr:hypothetical protein OIDMADRAFT_32631 [Oidiodendron maius Zn]
MKSSSPFSILLFVHLITAAPLPSILLDRWRDRSCTKPGNTLPDQYLPIWDAPLAVEEAPAPEDIVTLITSAAALRVEDMKESSRYEILVSPTDDDKRVPSWCQQATRQARRASREYSELLVISIVILFLIALTAWEAVWQSSRL